jgi:acetyl esterase/lipase
MPPKEAKAMPWNDLRLDSRQIPILKMLAAQQPAVPATDLPDSEQPSWEEMSQKANSPSAQKALQIMESAMLGEGDTDVYPTNGLSISEGEPTSSPDGNKVKYIYMRPTKFAKDEKIPCVYYIHGGGMATMSVFYSIYQQWLRTIAHQGVAVFAIDFRNSMTPSSSKEVKPFPAGLNDCVSGLKYLHAHAGKFAVDPDKIMVSGESGGGNLTIATVLTLKAESNLRMVSCFYPLCPYIAGDYPQPDRFPSTLENNGILLNLGPEAKHTYGVSAFYAGDCRAWPSFATVDDLKGLPPVFVSVNECDPLRDEGVEFYRKCSQAGVTSQCRIVMGTMHGGELLGSMPDVARETARSMASFAWGEAAAIEFKLFKSAL